MKDSSRKPRGGVVSRDTHTPETRAERRRPYIGDDYTIIDNRVLQECREYLGKSGRSVYIALCRYADSKGRCFPAVATLARDAEVSEPTVRASLKMMERLGVVRVERTKGGRSGGGKSATNHYTLLPFQEPNRQAILELRGKSAPRPTRKPVSTNQSQKNQSHENQRGASAKEKARDPQPSVADAPPATPYQQRESVQPPTDHRTGDTFTTPEGCGSRAFSGSTPAPTPRLSPEALTFSTATSGDSPLSEKSEPQPPMRTAADASMTPTSEPRADRVETPSPRPEWECRGVTRSVDYSRRTWIPCQQRCRDGETYCRQHTWQQGLSSFAITVAFYTRDYQRACYRGEDWDADRYNRLVRQVAALRRHGVSEWAIMERVAAGEHGDVEEDTALPPPKQPAVPCEGVTQTGDPCSLRSGTGYCRHHAWQKTLTDPYLIAAAYYTGIYPNHPPQGDGWTDEMRERLTLAADQLRQEGHNLADLRQLAAAGMRWRPICRGQKRTGEQCRATVDPSKSLYCNAHRTAIGTHDQAPPPITTPTKAPLMKYDPGPHDPA